MIVDFEGFDPNFRLDLGTIFLARLVDERDLSRMLLETDRVFLTANIGIVASTGIASVSGVPDLCRAVLTALAPARRLLKNSETIGFIVSDLLVQGSIKVGILSALFAYDHSPRSPPDLVLAQYFRLTAPADNYALAQFARPLSRIPASLR